MPDIIAGERATFWTVTYAASFVARNRGSLAAGGVMLPRTEFEMPENIREFNAEASAARCGDCNRRPRRKRLGPTAPARLTVTQEISRCNLLFGPHILGVDVDGRAYPIAGIQNDRQDHPPKFVGERIVGSAATVYSLPFTRPLPSQRPDRCNNSTMPQTDSERPREEFRRQTGSRRWSFNAPRGFGWMESSN